MRIPQSPWLDQRGGERMKYPEISERLAEVGPSTEKL
jgi:hypothetical protein